MAAMKESIVHALAFCQFEIERGVLHEPTLLIYVRPERRSEFQMLIGNIFERMKFERTRVLFMGGPEHARDRLIIGALVEPEFVNDHFLDVFRLGSVEAMSYGKHFGLLFV